MGFSGSQRFEIVRSLGEGGMGLVFEAYDRERKMPVALKTLRHLDPTLLYRFKREFRALTEASRPELLSHPNIVGLYELFAEGDDWFFTMELVRGADVVRWLRPPGFEPPPAPRVDEPTTVVKRTRDRAPGRSSEAPRGSLGIPVASVCDLVRLRHALPQLVRALEALHGSAMVHRDLKPSNVLVTEEGRLVLLDFGIVAEASLPAADPSLGQVLGTPAFMAPEQALGETVTAAADYYSLGVLLYLALTDRLPFEGDGASVLMAKQQLDPVPPSSWVSDLPHDLEALCLDLLRRKPAERPGAGDVLARLGVQSARPLHTETSSSGGDVFVGRAYEVERLHAAAARLRDGARSAVVIVGASGMGKSTLVRRFVHEIEAASDRPVGAPAPARPLVLFGRCHERESLPYQAFDGIIDGLSGFLVSTPAERVASWLPPDLDQLLRVFPVLRRVAGADTLRAPRALDPQQGRARAFAALRELFSRLAREMPIVLYVDDLQWADRESLELLVAIGRGAAAPALLLLGAMRAEALASAHHVEAALARFAPAGVVERLELSPLSPDEQRTMVGRLLGGQMPPPALGEDYWAESHGNPLFMAELVRFAREEGAQALGSRRFEDVLAWRVSRLAPAAQTLLEVVAVSAAPAPLWVLIEATDLGPTEAERASAALRAGHLARTVRHGDRPWLDTYHDRVRETLLARMPEARRRDLHERLAHALERWDQAPVDALARHWLEAGDPQHATRYFVSAARAAADKLAFHRAAELYRAALRYGRHAEAESRKLQRALGEALSHAGFGLEAAEVYLVAAEGAPAADATDLERAASEQLLRGGHLERGLDVLARVMGRLGLRVAPTRKRALASLLLQRTRIGLRGLGWKRKEERNLRPADLERLDVLYAASTSLGMIDHIRGADFQTRHLLGALRLGEERRVCRALAIEVVFRSSEGKGDRTRTERLFESCVAMARALDDPYLRGVAELARGARAFFGMRFRPAAEAFTAADRVFTSECVGTHWEQVTARYMMLEASIWSGELEEVARRADAFIEEAERQRDVYARSMFRCEAHTWSLLQRDEPERALLDLQSALDGWPKHEMYVAHLMGLSGKSAALLYAGRPGEVLAEIDAVWPRMRASMLLRVTALATVVHLWQGLAALAAGSAEVAARAARELARGDTPVTQGLSDYMMGAIALGQRGREVGLPTLRRAVARLDEGDMALFAAAARFRLGELEGGADGAVLCERALAYFRTQGSANPQRMIAFAAPLLAK